MPFQEVRAEPADGRDEGRAPGVPVELLGADDEDPAERQVLRAAWAALPARRVLVPVAAAALVLGGLAGAGTTLLVQSRHAARPDALVVRLAPSGIEAAADRVADRTAMPLAVINRGRDQMRLRGLTYGSPDGSLAWAAERVSLVPDARTVVWGQTTTTCGSTTAAPAGLSALLLLPSGGSRRIELHDTWSVAVFQLALERGCA